MLAVALAGMAIAGTGRGLGDVADTTLVQARTDDARRSRVFAAQDGAAHAAYSAAMLVGGLIVPPRVRARPSSPPERLRARRIAHRLDGCLGRAP